MPKPHVTARVWYVRKCATKGRTDVLGNTSAGSVACQEDIIRVEDPFLISIADVSRAHFFADAVRDVYVRLPDEDPKAKQPGMCGKLRKTMYGSLDAAQRWRDHYAPALEIWLVFPRRGFSVQFSHKDLETYILVHGGDFFIGGEGESMH